MTLIGVLALTPDTLFLRLARLDELSLMFWRGVLIGTALLVGYALVTRKNPLAATAALGRWGSGVAILYGLSTIAFVGALERTTVANVLVALATIPLGCALLSRLTLGEAIPGATKAAIAAAFAGMLIVAQDGLETGRWLGDLYALVASLTVAGALTLTRRHRDINMVPAAALGHLGAALVVVAFAPMPAITQMQWLWIVLGNAIIVPLAMALIALGPRYISAADVGLLMLLETVLGPYWVWLAIGEQPSARALVGGAIVISTLTVHALVRARAERVTIA